MNRAANELREINERGVGALSRNDFESARRIFEDLTTRAPNSGAAWNNLGYAFLRLGRLDDAVRTLEKAIARGGGTDALYHLALTQRAQGDLPGAEATCGRALEASPDDPGVLALLAELYARSNLADAMLICLRRLLEVSPNGYAEAVQLGNVLLAAGELDLAEALFQMLKESAPST